MTTEQTHIAVLTGDIIGSTKMEPGDLTRAFDALSAAAEVQADWHGEDLHFTRQRGDGWQVRLARPELALRSALAFRAALRCEGKEFSTFIAVAEGAGNPIAPNTDLNKATGATFINSGRTLDRLKESPVPVQMGHQSADATTAAFILADYISQTWTPAQAAAILPMLSPGKLRSHTDVALALGKSRQAVTKALDGAGFDAIWLALKNIEAEETQDD
ncbi:MarR family transcriptional regulator [Aliiroseovarius subalbicans]|uniref:MarR family transcriptional regulator n=1 Tax=Aliiroseovarius subalbicans TaxID=2925840 RepID=UPI001F5AB268|nr:MarR family transcriptional regulator [Aliiroseovarius subalbicans]MCI2398721.1 MarR family transcriptional regulator [Aliiroseovarius subalbicans]